MRALLVVLALSCIARAQDNLPRAGGGWTGFKAGSWVRVKRTRLSQKKVPRVTITTTTLKLVTADTLTLESEAANALGMKQKSSQEMPAAGEAGKGETATVQKLEDEVVFTAGKKFQCSRKRTTLSGPAGKRIVTEWISKSAPRMRIKRTQESRDLAGKVVGRSSIVLMAINEQRTAGTVTLKCLKYSMRSEQGETRLQGTLYASREVPGYVVWSDLEATRDGKVVFTVRDQVLDFAVK